MSEPLYTCEYEDCAEEYCYPANMLKVYEGKVWCEGCWENAPTIWPDGQGGDTGCDWLHWHDLEPFVPEHEKRIAQLEAVNDMQAGQVRVRDKFIEQLEAEAKTKEDAIAALREQVEELTRQPKYGANHCQKHDGYGFTSDCVVCYPRLEKLEQNK
jgi:hypothetical protein